MEKFKDLIHDYTDILLAVAIAISMILVVNWHLGSWLPISNTVAVTNTTPTTTELNLDELQELLQPEEEDDEEDEIDEENEIDEEVEPVDEDSETQIPSDNEIIEVDNITITIPDGSTGSLIGTILYENGLIEEVNLFISTAENLNLASRLQSGTFQIPEDATIEDMVKIISRQVR